MEKRILLQCQNLTYFYFGLAAIYTKYAREDVIVDVLFTRYRNTDAIMDYIKLNKNVENVFDVNYKQVHKISKKIDTMTNTFANRLYFNVYFKHYMQSKISKMLNKNTYDSVFYNEGSTVMCLISTLMPTVEYVIYGDGSGLLYNRHASKWLDINNVYKKPYFLNEVSPNEIISLAPYKKDDSLNTDGLSITATNTDIIVELIKSHDEVQSVVNNFAQKIENEYKGYDKKIFLMASRLDAVEYFLMNEEEQINIYVDMINEFATKNSLVILKQHPNSKADLVEILSKRCDCKIIGVPAELNLLPAEAYVKLLFMMDKIITFISSSKIAIKMLYDIDTDDAWDIIQRYHLKERVNSELEFFKELIEKLPTWDKKSIILEKNMIPVLEAFHEKYKYLFPENELENKKNTFFENIFSVKIFYDVDIKRKVITIFGLKIKTKV